MRRAYILIYSNALGDRSAIKDWANTEDLVITWRYDLPNTIYLISEAEAAAELSQSLLEKIGKRARFLLMEVSENRQGLLPSDTWFLLREKRRKPKTAD